MIVLEAWPPVRCSQQGLHCARQVHESIAHQEKHREERCQEIHIAEKNPALTDENGQEEGSGWFTTGGRDGKGSEKGDDAILSNGLRRDIGCRKC